MQAQLQKGHIGLPMTGLFARWYAKITGKDMEQYQKAAQDVAAGLTSGSHVLEVAPGPGYFAVELAKLDNYQIVGLDISHTFVRIATENAKKAGVDVEFRQGDAFAMPFEANSFDFIYCRAAFRTSGRASRGNQRNVSGAKTGRKGGDLRPPQRRCPERHQYGGRRNGTWVDQFHADQVDFQALLLKRAYLPDDFRRMAAQTPIRDLRNQCRVDFPGHISPEMNAPSLPAFVRPFNY